MQIVQNKFKKATKKHLFETVIEIQEKYSKIPTKKGCKKELEYLKKVFKK
eukprot:CAMPEP_0114586654 /NCGR_PEP_ID=MMETSP0125-20121206/9812_1 /TAXON_ID=485358 ORGANISM="Aristerostoma sp., Strain ATCC 50986" /NCGR_SAMPLE_ID=MMETSP0125 /ASSEMBLY_ACC=CAM_ASM_000245 /LENGTH=49 /DNA_ID=CAMNT_0001782177 /DNA_START=990 /DNA_END=1139 /DNA_ORIENTATION=+